MGVDADQNDLGAFSEKFPLHLLLPPNQRDFRVDFTNYPDCMLGSDDQAHKVIDLKAFGDLVHQKLSATLGEETSQWENRPAPTWHQQEKETLAEYC